MVKELSSIEISNVPDLLRIAEEVQTTGKARILRRDGEELALIIPLALTRRSQARRSKTQADYDAFRSAAGGWKGLVDADQLL